MLQQCCYSQLFSSTPPMGRKKKVISAIEKPLCSVQYSYVCRFVFLLIADSLLMAIGMGLLNLNVDLLELFSDDGSGGGCPAVPDFPVTVDGPSVAAIDGQIVVCGGHAGGFAYK